MSAELGTPGDESEAAPAANESAAAPPANESIAAPPADPALSIPARRLAGSGHCLNCGVELKGPYCHHCGQPDRRFQRVLPVLLRDLLADLIDLDARFFRTLTPLLTRPGLLTRDFLAGKRSRYTPPIRLYLFSSVVFFLLAALLGSEPVRIQTNSGDGDVRIDFSSDAPLLSADGPAGAAVEGDAPGDPDELDIQFNGEPWDPVTNPVAISFLPEFVNGWINDEIGDSPRKAKAISKNPSLFTDKMYDLLPGTMFLLLPLAALLFQFWHLLSKRYFVEHLIFALHCHAFAFAAASVAMVVGSLGDLISAHGPVWAGVLFGLLRVFVLLWVPVYLLLALKRVYQQGWLATLIKFAGIAFCYALLLGFVTAGVSLVSFVLL